MKLSKIRIKNLFGISEMELDGKDREFVGDNAVGKTSLIDAIRLALRNRSDREYLIKGGCDEGEVLIETDTGLSVVRRIRTKKADYSRIKQDGERGAMGVKTEAFLREYFTELQLDPVAFLRMSHGEQNRMILDLIDFKWNMAWIQEQFGEVPPGINWEQNILAVLYDIQREGSPYYEKRQEVNREIKANHANIEEIGKDLPKDYNAEYWRSFNLSDKYSELERSKQINQQISAARSFVANKDNKFRAIEADTEIAIGAARRAHELDIEDDEKRIRELEQQIQELRSGIQHKNQHHIDKIELIQSRAAEQKAAFQGEVQHHEELAGKEPVDTTELQQQVEQVLAMREHGNEYDRMVRLQQKNEKLLKQGQDLTAKIEKARALPGEILQKSSIPIKGITVENGIPLINGLPISNLSEGEKLELCIDVAASKPEGLQILLIDGVEKLSTHNRDRLYKKLKQRGIQFMATRTTDSPDLTVIEFD